MVFFIINTLLWVFYLFVSFVRKRLCRARQRQHTCFWMPPGTCYAIMQRRSASGFHYRWINRDTHVEYNLQKLYSGSIWYLPIFQGFTVDFGCVFMRICAHLITGVLLKSGADLMKTLNEVKGIALCRPLNFSK